MNTFLDPTNKTLDVEVPEDIQALAVLKSENGRADTGLIVQSLREDKVVLLRNIADGFVDTVMRDVAAEFGLSDTLKLQAGFAAFQGARHNVGQFFMSVNERGDYQLVPPHSEGTRRSDIQLAAFYCYENSTDGGESILMNADEASPLWPTLREKITKAKVSGRALTPREAMRARGLYQVQLPDDLLAAGDEILNERQTEIPGLSLVDVLAKPRKAYSRVLRREVYVYWDNISNIDYDSIREFVQLLRASGSLKEPQGGLEVLKMDSSADRRILHSGVKYKQLFKRHVACKLTPRDLLIQNNLTWTHAATNWTPGTGIRNVTASFA